MNEQKEGQDFLLKCLLIRAALQDKLSKSNLLKNDSNIIQIQLFESLAL